jgi:hypothetical protein
VVVGVGSGEGGGGQRAGAKWPRIPYDEADRSEIDGRREHQNPEQHSYAKDAYIAHGRRQIAQQVEQRQGRSEPSQPTQRCSRCHVGQGERVKVSSPSSWTARRVDAAS